MAAIGRLFLNRLPDRFTLFCLLIFCLLIFCLLIFCLLIFCLLIFCLLIFCLMQCSPFFTLLKTILLWLGLRFGPVDKHRVYGRYYTETCGKYCTEETRVT